jgi:hypothetical protein
MKLCVLHCGHPKTGTSSLQRDLTANAATLADHGILYPRLERPAGRPAALPWAGYQHGPALKALVRPGKSTFPLDQLQAILDETPHEVVLLSAEFLMEALFYLRQSAIWDWLTAQGYRIETISYLRDQPERLNSAYAQKCKTASFYLGFDAYCAGLSGQAAPVGGDAASLRMFYGLLSEEGAHGWGRHTFRPYSAAIKERGVEADFMESLGGILARHGLAPGLTAAVVGGFARPARANDSDGVLLVALCRDLARRIEAKFQVDRSPQPLCRAAYLCATGVIAEMGVTDAKYSALTAARVTRLRGVFAPGNGVLAMRACRCWDGVFPLPDLAMALILPRFRRAMRDYRQKQAWKRN